MKLTASPFDPQTGELLPVYRDAYLNGDLSRSSAKAVENYLHRDADQAHDTLNRWQVLHTAEAVEAPTWVQKQIQHIRTEPTRFRRRSTTIVAATVLLGTMVFAGTRIPTERVPTENVPTKTLELAAIAPAGLEAAEASATASSVRMIAVRGRILNEEGAPLIGATVLHPGSGRGVSTNADGEYVMHVPAGTTTLKYGYGGYQDEEMTVKGSRTANVTLLPQEKQKRHWWQF